VIKGSAARVRLSVRRNDTVEVIAGKDRGKRGKVLRVDRKRGRVVVSGVNMVHKHQKPTQKIMQGGIIEQENPVAVSTVMLVCPHCKQRTRVGHKVLEDGRRVRRCVRCGEAIERPGRSA